MSVERRKFLKLAGLAALGVAGGATGRVLAEDSLTVDTTPAQTPAPVSASGPLTAKRWAMVIDVKK